MKIRIKTTFIFLAFGFAVSAQAKPALQTSLGCTCNIPPNGIIFPIPGDHTMCVTGVTCANPNTTPPTTATLPDACFPNYNAFYWNLSGLTASLGCPVGKTTTTDIPLQPI